MTLYEDDIDFGSFMSMTDAQHKVRAVNDYRQDLSDEVAGISEWGKVSYMPWPKLQDLFAFRRGEVTVWAGMNGHGKSLMVGQVAMSLTAQGEVVLIFSFEMKPRRTLARQLRQFGGRDIQTLPISAVDHFIDAMEGKLWLYDQQGMVVPEKIIAIAKWAIEHRGVTHVVYDNLAKLTPEEDLERQKVFVDAICTVARDTNTHHHIIHHPRKLLDETKPPRKLDLRGSSTISDAPDNICMVWKNKPKQEARAQNNPSKDNEPDALLIVDKQRNGEWEGKLGLAFHSASQQFIPTDQYGAYDYASGFPHTQLRERRA